MKVTILGSGTSSGVPVIACDCAVCQSPDPRNHRLRSSILVEWQGTNILVDSGPDFRQQALRADLRSLDAVLYTHAHADHIAGLDDLRVFSRRQGRLPCFGSAETVAALRASFAYVFEQADAPGWRPQLDLCVIDGPFEAAGRPVHPVPVLHGDQQVLGFRFGELSYVTDCNHIPPSSLEALRGSRILILSALRYRPHPKHFNFDEALEVVRDLAPQRALFIHMNHEVDHADPKIDFPPNVELSYDGLVLEID